MTVGLLLLASELLTHRHAGSVAEGWRVAIAKITGQGLTSIAIVVALLWACALGERLVIRRANAEAAQVLSAMRVLRTRQRRQPAAAPARPLAGRRHVRQG